MSSILKTFEGDFLKNPMCIEFSSWIKHYSQWKLWGFKVANLVLMNGIKCIENI